MLSNISAIMFDMDGTLIQSLSVIEQAWTTVAKKYDVQISPAIIDDHIHGRSGSYTLHYLFGHFDSEQQKRIKQEVDTIEETSNCDLVLGAKAFLQKLKKNNIKTALVTASWNKRIEHIFILHDLHQYFDCIVSREEVKNGKPDPESYLLAAEKLQISMADSLIFEDSISGIEAAQNSGAKCVVIGEQKAYDGIFPRYENYTDVLNAMENQTV